MSSSWRAQERLERAGWRVEACETGYVAEKGPRGVWAPTLAILWHRIVSGKNGDQ